MTRSAGQESSGVGRIEALFAGGHLEAPVGPLDLPTHPASRGRTGPPPARPGLGGTPRHPHRRRRPDVARPAGHAGQRVRDARLGRGARPGADPGPATAAPVDGPRGDAARDRDDLRARRRRTEPGDAAPLPRLARPGPGPGAMPRAGRAVRGDGRRGRRRRRGREGRPGAARRRHARCRPGLAAGPLQGAEPARHALVGGLCGRHARDGRRLERAAGRSPPSSAGRCATASMPTTSGSTPSATCRTSTRRGTSLYSTYVFRLAAGPGRDARPLAPAEGGGQRGHRPPRRHDQPPARRRRGPRPVPGGREGSARHGRAGSGGADASTRTG